MKIGIAVLNEAQRQELSGKKVLQEGSVQWVNSTSELMQLKESDYWIDCTFSGGEIPYFEKPTLIHAPCLTLKTVEPDREVARFCAWTTFLGKSIWEISIANNSSKAWLEKWMGLMEQKFILVKDEPGFIAPRIVCTIINEAYHALRASISSAEEIDVAMKLGTNYPYGPIEWSQKIGIEQVYCLLQTLSLQNNLYTPAFQVN